MPDDQQLAFDERPLTAPAHEGMADEHDHGWAVDDR